MFNVLGVVQNSLEVTVAANTQVGILQVTAHTLRGSAIVRWGVYADVRSVEAEPVIVNLVRHSLRGTGTEFGATSVKPVANSVYGRGLSVVNTSLRGPQYDGAMFHPQGGYEVFYPAGYEVDLEPGGSVGIDVFTTATINAKAKLWFIE